MDTQRKDDLNVGSSQLVTKHCILTGMAPLSREILIQAQVSWEPKRYKEKSLYSNTHCRGVC